MIEYTDSLNKHLAKAVREFNAKVNYLTAQGNKYLPPKESVNDLKNTYYEEDMLLRKINQLERFTNEGAETIVQTAGGARTTRWQLQVLKEDTEYMIRTKSKELQTYGEIIPTVRGMRQSFKYREMGDSTYRNLEQTIKGYKKDYTTLDQADYNKFVNKMRTHVILQQRQKYIFWNNYFEFIDDVAYKADVDPELVEKVKDKLSKMDVDSFKLMYDTEKEFKAILDDYNLQKKRTEGFTESEKTDIQDGFEAVLKVMDEYIKE